MRVVRELNSRLCPSPLLLFFMPFYFVPLPPELVDQANIYRVNKYPCICRASDILRKKKQNFAGFSGANSRKNRPISRDFRGKKVKFRGTIARFQAIFAGEKSKFAGKSAHFEGF